MAFQIEALAILNVDNYFFNAIIFPVYSGVAQW